MDAREELLDIAGRYGFFRAASFTTEEMPRVLDSHLLDKIELLALNRDEAAALAGVSPSQPIEAVIESLATVEELAKTGLWTIVTAGKEGSWAWDGVRTNHLPAIDVEAVSAAGAGDAFMAGVLAGLASDLTLCEAQQLGNLTAALAVTSPHTINPGIDRLSLAALAAKENVTISDNVRKALSTPHKSKVLAV